MSFFSLSLTWHGVIWCPRWLLPAAESTSNVHVSVRTGPHSKGGLLWGKTLYFKSCWMCVRCLTGEYMVPGCFMGRRLAGGVSMTCFWLCSPWEIRSCHPCSCALPRRTYISINVDHVLIFISTIFPNGCCLFQQSNAPCNKAIAGQKLFYEHKKDSFRSKLHFGIL